jgi:DnaJ-class molecular chaperone
MRQEIEVVGEINEIKEYVKKYGNIDLKDLIKSVKGNRIHICPACKGVGQISRTEYRNYENQYWWEKCSVCEGFGYTEKEKKPKLRQIGWE